MAYNHGKEERKWRTWKEAEEKTLRNCGVPECIIEQLRTYDRADFNFDRRFYTHSRGTDTCLDMVAETESQIEVKNVCDLPNKIKNETLYQALLTMDKRTLQIVLLKIQGYSPKEIALIVGLTAGAVYAKLDYLRKKLKQFKR